MKFKKLHINNIASIEEAQLDFSSAPLSDAGVFLICGATGAGKSTILDSICLALYNTTPRFSSQNGNELPEGDMSMKDVRQILRRGAGYGSITLEFTGNNSRDYRMEWCAYRAHKKATGNMQAVKWSLTDTATGKELNKIRDIERAVGEATGMQFEQFCRTTMLAQGDFTRFLKSDDKEKGEILSRLTGVEIYGRIGRKAFEIWNDRKNEYDKASSALKALETSLLPEEEERNIHEELAGCRKNVEEQTGNLRQTEVKLKWLEASKTHEEAVKKQQKRLEEALENTASEKYKEYKEFVDQWDMTAEARKTDAVLRETLTDLEMNDKATGNSVRQYLVLVDAMDARREMLEEDRKQLEEIERSAAQYRDHEPLFAKYDEIAGMVLNITNGNDTITREKRKQEQNTVKLQAALGKAGKIKVVLDQATAKEKETTEAIALCDAEMKEMGADDIQRDYKRLYERSALLDKASRSLSAYRKSVETAAKGKENVDSLAAEIESMRQQLPLLKEAFEAAAERYRLQKKVYENQQESLDKWASRIRSALQVGDICPVCRRRVEEAIDSDEQIRAAVLQQKELCDDAERLSKKHETEFNKAEAGLKAKEEQHKTYSSNYAEALKESEKKLDQLNSEMEECGLEHCADTTEAILAKEVEETGKSLEAQNEKRKGVEQKMKTRRNLEKSLADTRKEMEKLLSLHSKALKESTRLQTIAAESDSMIKEALKRIEENKNTLTSLTGGYTWSVNPAEYPVLFSGMLRGERDENSRLKNEHAGLQQTILHTQQLLTAAQANLDAAERDLREEIARLSGQAEATPAEKESGKTHGAAAMPLEEIVSETAALKMKARKEAEEKNTLRGREKALRGELDTFFSGHTEITRELLDMLAGTEEKVTESRRKWLTDADNAVKVAREMTDSLLEKSRELEESRPEIAEEEDMESLSARKSTDMERLDALKLHIGSLEERLRKNELEKVRCGDHRKKVEEKLAQMNRWNRMKVLLGDANGNKFRKYAQTFILQKLICDANWYLRQLTDRYELKVNRGSFVIMVVDKYQGWQERSTATISGGESFQVSLALALALSNVGNNLCADTLFIDEGFGTLSGDALRGAINTLRQLHSEVGRSVGIISHIEELQESIPVQVRVERPTASSAATVTVITR